MRPGTRLWGHRPDSGRRFLGFDAFDLDACVARCVGDTDRRIESSETAPGVAALALHGID